MRDALRLLILGGVICVCYVAFVFCPNKASGALSDEDCRRDPSPPLAPPAFACCPCLACTCSADLSGQVLETPLALEWGRRILEEFRTQGELEAAADLPVTTLVSNDLETTAKGQHFFVARVRVYVWGYHFCRPMAWIQDPSTAPRVSVDRHCHCLRVLPRGAPPPSPQYAIFWQTLHPTMVLPPSKLCMEVGNCFTRWDDHDAAYSMIVDKFPMGIAPVCAKKEQGFFSPAPTPHGLVEKYLMIPWSRYPKHDVQPVCAYWLFAATSGVAHIGVV